MTTHERAAPMFSRRVALGASMLLVLGMAAPALGQSASVLGVLPEGVVLDATPFPDLRPGARIGFRPSDGSTTPVGEGWILDVREGRALVGLKPGGSVRTGDVAVLCATQSGPGSQAELRTSVQDLKTQLSSTGGGSPELQGVILQLESALDARETAIRDGACDVAAHDQQIAALAVQLQQGLAAPPVPPPSPAMPAGSADATSQPAPTVGAPAPATDSVSPTLQLVQGLVQIAQSLGVVSGGGTAAGPSSEAPPSSSVLPPTDPGSTPGASPPPPPGVTVGAPPAPLPAPLPVRPVVPTAPPPTGGTSPGGAPTGNPAPGGGSPTLVRPPLIPRQPGQGQWWTLTPPQAGAPGAAGPGTSSGSPGTSSGSPGTAPTSGSPTSPGSAPAGSTRPPSVTLTPRPVLKPAPDTVPSTLAPGTATAPGPGSVARVTPVPQRMATVQGVVRADNRSPVSGAVILVGGKRARSDADGLFQVEEVPLGRQILVITASGFVPGRVAMDLSSGEVEKVTVVLRRAPVAPPGPAPRSP